MSMSAYREPEGQPKSLTFSVVYVHKEWDFVNRVACFRLSVGIGSIEIETSSDARFH